MCSFFFFFFLNKACPDCTAASRAEVRPGLGEQPNPPSSRPSSARGAGNHSLALTPATAPTHLPPLSPCKRGRSSSLPTLLRSPPPPHPRPKGGSQWSGVPKGGLGGRKRSTEGPREVRAMGEGSHNFLASPGTAWRWLLSRTHKLPPTQSSQDSSRTSPGISPTDFYRGGRIAPAAWVWAALEWGSRPGRRGRCSPGTGAGQARQEEGDLGWRRERTRPGPGWRRMGWRRE